MKNMVRNQHDRYKAKIKSIKPNPLKTGTNSRTVGPLILSFGAYHLKNI